MNFVGSRRRTRIDMRIGVATRMFPFPNRTVDTIARPTHFVELNLAIGDGLGSTIHCHSSSLTTDVWLGTIALVGVVTAV